jgi:hypothetical protein
MNLLASLARFIVLVVVPIFVLFAIASVGPFEEMYWQKVPYPLHKKNPIILVWPRKVLICASRSDLFFFVGGGGNEWMGVLCVCKETRRRIGSWKDGS